MKIFLSFLQSTINHPIPAYSFWEFYIKNGLEEAGINWVEEKEIDWAQGLVPQNKSELNAWKEKTWEKTLESIKKEKPSIFLSYLYPQQIDKTALKEIKKLGIYCVNFFCDNIRLFDKAPEEFSEFDLNWVPEYGAMNLYKQANFKAINLPMPMWVNPVFRMPSTIETDRITFIGSKDIQRQLFFEKLIKLNPNLPLDIYGASWDNIEPTKSALPTSLLKKYSNQLLFLKNQGLNAFINKLKFGSFNPQLSDEILKYLKGKPLFSEYIDLTRNSKITIGINRYPSFKFPLYAPNKYSRLRDIEAPMLGACYLTEWVEGMNNLYEVGNEIETFNSQEEFLEKVEMLEKDALLRKKLRLNGQKRALSDHSIMSSLKKIVDYLK
ncbi:glycosyltransferase [Pedobacter flavus]|uniref:Glycosyltransferase n=1 Tax=Pedobacter flavus TaxID=3113906 RepID=A0ABU7H051_9SPHI|nr:glycosyltransferase [Pedobacter sp. VNH31]MEE1883921.1 glycosyltransferase [Pedobacter sp. VNH31]